MKRMAIIAMTLTVLTLTGTTTMAADITRYVRYDDGKETSFGIEEGAEIHQLSAAPWNGGGRTGKVVETADSRAPATFPQAADLDYRARDRRHLSR